MKRPVFLTIMLVILVLGSISQLQTYFNLSASPGSDLGVILMLIVGGVNLISAIMLWMWKKIGLYLLIGATIFVSLGSTNLITSGNSQATASLIMNILTLVVVYMSMKPVWKQFK